MNVGSVKIYYYRTRSKLWGTFLSQKYQILKFNPNILLIIFLIQSFIQIEFVESVVFLWVFSTMTSKGLFSGHFSWKSEIKLSILKFLKKALWICSSIWFNYMVQISANLYKYWGCWYFGIVKYYICLFFLRDLTKIADLKMQ